VAGDQTAIRDLLEVFSGLMEFMLEEISSSTSSNSPPLSAGNALVILMRFFLNIRRPVCLFCVFFRVISELSLVCFKFSVQVKVKGTAVKFE